MGGEISRLTGDARDTIDTIDALREVLDKLDGLLRNLDPPSLYLDFEGVKSGKNSRISILQLHILPTRETFLIDVLLLGARAFSTPSSLGYTFEDILESEMIPKIIFDVRNFSAALFNYFQIRIRGVLDLQLMEAATRHPKGANFNELSRCIELDLALPQSEIAAWKKTEKKGLDLFNPKYGGNYEVLDERPLSEEIKLYCVQKVQFLLNCGRNTTRRSLRSGGIG
ncbi:uncharacterized protein F4822DRAFT_148160 [Hypoxylon trugodes]|uniref:uncharacterized protein n=1 Tax=Hypoxylon trugodes TaxID=326681 RepID=UPI00219F4C1D|nr:uncharacterized protein F4822DRAFT_148160 [Hypoxylon trugodes]KAI1393007.1 hypothetical protein F4822DRAFT_148160 [Hypoxylon trugodes]